MLDHPNFNGGLENVYELLVLLRLMNKLVRSPKCMFLVS